MNYVQKTPFMELYEELSIMNEAEATEIMSYDEHQNEQVVSIDELNYLMGNLADELKTAIKNLNSSGISYKDKSMILFTKVENELTYYAPGVGWHRGKGVSQIDLVPSWLGFLFYLNGQTNLVNELIKQLKSTCSVRLDWSSAKIGKLYPQPGTPKLPAKLYGAYGIFIKYSELADDSVIMPFIQVIDSAKPVNNVLPFKSRFERAREFIEYFATIPKNRFYRPGKLETEADIRNCAFHVVDLVSAYNRSDAHLKNCMGSLLDIFGSKIGHNNPKDRSYIENWKSVQYLHNACYQEAEILKVANELGFPLQRNPAATGLNGNNWYLFAQGDKRVKGYADFIYTYANGIDIKDNKKIKVDAKIYLNTSTEAEAADPAAHDAVFLIEYLLDDELWQLKQIDRNAAKLDSDIAIQVEEKLNNFIRYLNENSIKFYMVNKYLQSRN